MSQRSNQRGFSVVEIGIVVVVVGIIGALGWKFYDAKFNQPQLNNISEEATIVDMLPESLSDLTDIATIKSDAVTDKPGVTVIHIELEQKDDGSLVYKAQLSDGTVTVYNARNGARMKSETHSEKSSEALPVNFTSGIGFAKALEIARAEKPGSKVYKIELELEGGVVVYSVRFTDKARVDVNAQDGTIVRTKAARVTDDAKKAEQAAKKQANVDSNSGRSSNDDSSDDSATHHSSTDDNSGKHSSGSGHDDSDDDLSHNDDDDDNDSDDDSSDDSGDSFDDSDNSGSGSSRN